MSYPSAPIGLTFNFAMRNFRHQQGFTLIELVIIIVVLGILMAGTAAYVTNSMIAYSDISRRDQLTSQGRLTMERIARSLRSALPNSLRVQNNCIEFLPILGSSIYTSLPMTSAGNSFTAIDFNLLAAAGMPYVVVYPYDTTAIYNPASPGQRATYASKAGSPTTTVTLLASHRFNAHAPQRRFYVVDSPTSYCIVGTDLNRYRGYDISASQSTPPAAPATAELMAENIQTNDGSVVTPFTYTPGTLRRNGIVALDFRFMIDNEWIRLHHEVQIRNVL